MPKNNETNRRKFLSTSATVAAGGIIAANAAPAFGGYHAGGDDTLRVGLIGCGGRGTGAAINACNADPNVKITALADAFIDRVDSCHDTLSKKLGDRLEVGDNKFDGFDNHEKLIATDVDVVLLATPPYFRPSHLEACVAAGKHVFCEKPVGVDVPGVRRVMEACKSAKDQGLSIVSGLCWRYDHGVRATMDQIKSGALGEILSIQENYLTGELWHRGENEKWSEMEYQMRNWLYFNWLSGDHPAEQHIHSLDKAAWLMDDEAPVRVYSLGGRQRRTAPQYGNIYDHFATVFEWENGVKCHSYCRQQAGCFNNTEDYVVGTKGSAKILRHEVVSGGETWKFRGKKPSMYDVEHQHLFKSIRGAAPINNGHYMCNSTLMALCARDAAYTGKNIKWDDFMKSETVLGPKELKWGNFTPGEIPIPGDKAW